MLALSAVVFAIAWWLGLYLAARDLSKPILRTAAVGLVGYALAVAVEASRLSSSGTAGEVLGGVELYLLCVPGLAWLLVLLDLRTAEADADPDTKAGTAADAGANPGTDSGADGSADAGAGADATSGADTGAGAGQGANDAADPGGRGRRAMVIGHTASRWRRSGCGHRAGSARRSGSATS